MLKRVAFIIVLIALITGSYYAWSQSDRNYASPDVDTRVQNISEYGKDSGKGNIIGIQPYMFAYDYSDRKAFLAKMNAYFQSVKDKNWLNNKTVVVLPEYLGSWLVVEREKSAVYDAKNMNQAMQLMVESNLDSFIHGFLISPAADRNEYALFALKSESMADAYNYVFSELAQKYKVTIVAGSIVLANPSIQEGRLVSSSGALYSVSPVFSPDGKVQALTYKCFPITTEQPFLKAASLDKLAVTDTPVGKLGVMVCADSWYPQSYEVMKEKGADAVVVPSYTMGDGEMEKPWFGYSGYPNPTDVDPSDLGKITLQQAWDKYTLGGRLPQTGIMNGMIVCLRGQLWDLGSDGSGTVIKEGQRFNQPNIDGADLVNFWL